MEISKIKYKKNIIKNPKFSVLMANYNNGRFIAEAIQSVLKQTFQDWELVIVDDCSNDNSIDIIIPYLKDKRIKLIQNEKNSGYINTLKRLVNESKACIFCILDSDDGLTEYALSIMYKYHIKYPICGLIYSQFFYCDDELNYISNGFCKAVPSGKSNLQCNCVSHFKTFKKKYFLKTNGFNVDILYAEDKDIILKMEEVSKLLFIDKVLYKHRILSTSQSHDPKKTIIGLISNIYANFLAYNRRLNTDIPNLSRNEMSTQLFLGAALCTKQRNLRKFILFIINAIKLDPFNFKLLKTYKKEFDKYFNTKIKDKA